MVDIKNYKYDVFIAYHGTYDANGSLEAAEKLKEYLSTKCGLEVYLHGHVGETNDVEWNATWEIIQDCRCMICVINDNVPMTIKRQLGNNKGERISQIRKEVDAFFGEVDRGNRSLQDFNFFYTGEELNGSEQEELFMGLYAQGVQGHNNLLSWGFNGDMTNYTQAFDKINAWLLKRGCTPDPDRHIYLGLHELCDKLGWKGSIFFSPKELLEHEEKLSNELESLTLIASHTTDDVKGGKIFPLVTQNLKRGVHYSYIFFKGDGAKKQLENIWKAQTEINPEASKLLTLKYIRSDVWLGADIALIKVYEFKGERRPEIIFRIKLSKQNGGEQCVYIKGASNKVSTVQQEIDDMLEGQDVQEYNGKKWVTCEE